MYPAIPNATRLIATEKALRSIDKQASLTVRPTIMPTMKEASSNPKIAREILNIAAPMIMIMKITRGFRQERTRLRCFILVLVGYINVRINLLSYHLIAPVSIFAKINHSGYNGKAIIN